MRQKGKHGMRRNGNVNFENSESAPPEKLNLIYRKTTKNVMKQFFSISQSHYCYRNV